MSKKVFSMIIFLLFGLFTSVGYVSADITSNLQAYYDFEGDLIDSVYSAPLERVYTGTASYYTTGLFGDAFYLGNGETFITQLGYYYDSGPFTVSWWQKGHTTASSISFGLSTNQSAMQARGKATPAPFKFRMSFYNGTTVGAWDNQNVNLAGFQHYVATYDGTYFKYYMDGTLRGISAAAYSINAISGPLVLGGYCNTNCSSVAYSSTPGNIIFDELRVYNRALTSGDVTELYGHEPGPTDEDGLCGLVLGFTGSFDEGEACLGGTFTGLTTFDINGYTGYSYTCEPIGSGLYDYCVTAEQTTGSCGTMQSQTFYQDIDDYSSQYTYCSGGNSLMTGLAYLAGDGRDRYCNGPTEFGPQAYCAAFEYNQDTPICGNAHLQTYSTGDWETYGTGAMLCSNGEVLFLEFSENYGWLWECAIDYSASAPVQCVTYLTGGLGYIGPSYTGDNPFIGIDYSQDDTLQALATINFLKDRLPWFGTVWDTFIAYFAFFPQGTSPFGFYVPNFNTNGKLNFQEVVLFSPDTHTLFSQVSCTTNSCIYTSDLGISVERSNSIFSRLFSKVLPVLFGLIYVCSIIILIMLLLFLPIYLLFPIFSYIASLLFDTSNSLSNGLVKLISQVFFMGLLVSLSFSILYLYIDLVPPFIESFKSGLGYLLTFMLSNIFFQSKTLMRQTVIFLNYSFWSLLASYLFVKFTRLSS